MKQWIILSAVLSALCLLTSCRCCWEKKGAEPGGISDDERADALWKKIDGYKEWKGYPGWEGWQESDSVHGDFVKIYVNQVDETFPAGSIVVKEGFSKKDDSTLRAITVMERIDGYDEELADWLSVRYNESGKVTMINSKCARCHDDADGGDLIFLND